MQALPAVNALLCGYRAAACPALSAVLGAGVCRSLATLSLAGSPSSDAAGLQQQQQQQQQQDRTQEAAAKQQAWQQQQPLQQVQPQQPHSQWSWGTLQQAQPQQQQHAHRQRLQRHSQQFSALRALSSSSAAAAAGTEQDGPVSSGGTATTTTDATTAAAAAVGAPLSASGLSLTEEQQLDQLLQVLLSPMPHNAAWNAQLSPYLVGVNGQLLVQPSEVLLSVVRALQVIRGVLQEDGQVYIVETNRQLRPLIKTAAQSCINPSMWFYYRTWSPGTLTNYASGNRLFKESHQPNRRLFAAKGLRPVNPLCPKPPPSAAPLPRLTWDDKWLLYRRTRKPGYRGLLEELLVTEDQLHRFKPAGSMRGTPRHLALLVFLDSTKNAVAIREAANSNIPTIAVVNTANDMSQVTYPVLARDFSPNFIHFFLDWIIKVANAAPRPAQD